MNTKKGALTISATYVVFFISIFLTDEFCTSAWCRVHDDDLLGLIFFTFLPLLPIFLLSLITYKMREEVFRAWWGFARWWVLVIIAVTLFLQNAGGGGGMGISGAVSGAFDVLILGLFYTILVITSLVKIVRTYLKTRGG